MEENWMANQSRRREPVAFCYRVFAERAAIRAR